MIGGKSIYKDDEINGRMNDVLLFHFLLFGVWKKGGKKRKQRHNWSMALHNNMFPD